ncbi:type III secretion system inner membrane ring lipoprotein SctJ [Falsirhodobacter sp. 20TX0035]|uniref:type III secretion system inner membrane ring lipoprotein SctJ n=1 Tax=Falsirhodobacter sp. 20TX0035 TaxID=3022019 RepID=UPI00232C6AA2|nr:type III secretion inner membrane ring lipoprotein SctJ [Falsirhodobacter sp. 20TX0035]MDB6454404.1 type III secretion inner membrane ring lipoprotein SctJ [Falsirhodobacter sp. 20TX0035]
MKHRLCLLALTALLTLAGCKEDLYTNLDEHEANLIVATLGQEGIPARRIRQEDGQMTVTVDEARFPQAVALLEEAGLPRQKFASMGEVFKQEGLVSTPTQERARMLYALSEELSRTVSEIDGILSARVHIVLPDNDPLRSDLQPSSASVFVRHEAGLDAAALIPRIKTLVANGIAGLTYDAVSVVTVAAPPPRTDARTQPMVQLLGVWVLETSYARAVTILAVLAGACVALAGLLAFVLWRRRTQVRNYRLEVLD